MTSKKKTVSLPPVSDARRVAASELHQLAGEEHPVLTTQQGVQISDNQNSLKANPRGPTLLEDFILREKITHFDHERIPERIVHARGTGVHGFFELTTSLSEYTTAKVLTEVGERTPLFMRFSTVAGGSGSSDTPRDVRGFAFKLYTKEGNWDLVGEQHPGFFHPRCDQVSRSHPRSENGAGPWIPPSLKRTRYVLGLHFSHPGGHAYGDVAHVRPNPSTVAEDDGRLRNSQLSSGQC
jgi:hypothetical protein